VLDVAMPDMDGLAVLSNVRSSTRVVLLTATATDSQLLTAILYGARGFVLKDESADSLLRCIHKVAAGGRWFPSELIDEAANAQPDGATERHDQALTSREREVARLVSEGLSNKEVGRRLNVTEGTVKIHLHKIYDKMGVSNRTALAALAIAQR
jgi:two-component system nitrate/nitrite response regulator NarL